MFCKWCGNDLQLTDKACPACGRHTPPMSDCGGFYNLKHGNQATATPPRPPQELPRAAFAATPIDHPAKQPSPKPAKRKGTVRSHVFTLIGFVAALLAIVFLVVLVIGLTNQLTDIKEQLASMPEDVLTEPSEMPSVDPTDPAPSLEPSSGIEATTAPSVESPVKQESHTLSVCAEIDLSEATVIRSAYNFGDYAKSFTVLNSPECDLIGKRLTTTFTLDTEESLQLTLSYTQTKEDALIITAGYESTISLFEQSKATYEWQFFSGQDTWMPVSSDPTANHIADAREIHCSQKWLETVSSDGEPVKLQCRIRVQSESGDSLNITLSGISVATDGTIVTNYSDTK